MLNVLKLDIKHTGLTSHDFIQVSLLLTWKAFNLLNLFLLLTLIIQSPVKASEG